MYDRRSSFSYYTWFFFATATYYFSEKEIFMDFFTLVFLSVGLAMDAFAVSITNGLCYPHLKTKHALFDGLTFGFFQMAMPIIGYFIGSTFSFAIRAVDHWIALILLCFIGGNMVREAVTQLRHPECPSNRSAFNAKLLFVQGIATSIDALAIGVSFAVMDVSIITAAALIGIITFGFSFGGIFIGKKFGGLLKEKAEMIGGFILIFIGLKIFIEHMF